MGVTLKPYLTFIYCFWPQLEGRVSGLFSLYIMGAIIMVLAILGAYGAHKESRVALIVVSTKIT